MVSPGAAVRWTAPDGRWTQPDLQLFPQDGHRYEILDGSLHVTPPADDRHSAIVESIVTTLRSAAPPGWWVCARLGIVTGDSNLVPDVLVLRPQSSGAIWADPTDVALVVEVEAGATRRYDRLLKPDVYATAGIPAFWRVEEGPILRSFELDGATYRPDGDVRPDERVRLGVPYPVWVNPAAWHLG